MRSNNSSRAAFPLSKFVGIQDENLNSRGSEKTNSRAISPPVTYFTAVRFWGCDTANIDHGKAGQGLTDVTAYNPAVEANYVFALNALRVVDFPLLAQLASHKDASMLDIMGLLRLEGLTAETPKVKQLQPSPEQLMLPIHRPGDQVVIGKTSLSFSLDVIHTRVQRIRGDAAAHRLSLSDAMVPLIGPLSAENLTSEASTSRVSATATITALSTTFIRPTSSLQYQWLIMKFWVLDRLLKFLPPPRLCLRRRSWRLRWSILRPLKPVAFFVVILPLHRGRM
ncbi:hypothetical protein Tco_1503535 [Tanacetum coccineum]